MYMYAVNCIVLSGCMLSTRNVVGRTNFACVCGIQLWFAHIFTIICQKSASFAYLIFCCDMDNRTLVLICVLTIVFNIIVFIVVF